MAVPYSVKKNQLIQKAKEKAQGQAVSKPASSGTPFANAAAEAAYAAAVPSYKVPVKTTTNAEKVTKDVSQEKKDKVYSSFPGYTKKRAEETKAEAEKAKSAVEEAEGQEFDWTDANQRKQHEEAVKQKKAEAAQANKKARQAEANAVYAADMAEINSLSEEERTALQTYADELSNTNDSRLSGGNLFADIFSGSKMDQAEKVFSGKYDRKRLKELAETLNRVQNEEDTKKAEAAGKEAGGGGVAEKTLGTMGTFGANLVGSATGVAGYATELMGSTGRYPTLDPNNPGNIPNKYSEALRGQVVQDIRGEGDSALRSAAAYLYQGATIAADTVIRIAAAGIGSLGLAAAGSFGQTLAEASEKGATPEQAVLQATANAALEVMTEKIPLDNLLKTMKGGRQTAGQIVKGALAQAGIEATSEEINFVAQLMAEAAILQEKSGYNQRIGDMVANGMSYQEAKEAAQKELWEQAKQTAIVSGLSGGLSQAGASVATNLMTPKAQTTPVGQGVPQLTPEEDQPAQDQAQTEQLAFDLNNPTEQTAVTPIEEFGRIMNEKAPQQVRQEVKPPERISLEQAMAEVFGNKTPEVSQPSASDAAEYAASFEKAQEPQQREQRFPGYRAESVENPFSGRNWSDVGKRNVTAFMQDNPEIKNLFRAEAQNMLMELADTTRGERWYNDQTYYESGGKKGFGGVKRNTSDEIAELLDSGMTYEEIENGLNAIIRDEGAEQNAASKRIEFVLNDRLLNGHRDFYGSGRVPASSEYINQLREIQANKAGQEGFESLMQDADRYAPAVDTEKQYTDGGQLKQGAVGAAEQNFSGKAAYQDLLYEGNVQRDRPGDVRPMEVPKQDSYGRKVSEFVGNAYGAEITPDRMASQIESLVQDGALGFDRRSNRESMTQAADYIQKKGMDATRNEITLSISNGKIKDGDIEKAMLLYAEYSSYKSQRAIDNASEIMVDLATMANISGRNLQLFKMMRRMTPEGQLMTEQKRIQRWVDSMNQKRGAKDQVQVTIPSELEAEYLQAAKEAGSAKTEEAKQAAQKKQAETADAMNKVAASQVKATMKEKWDAWRYMAMLGNPLTQVRNVVGNVSFMPYKEAKDKIGAVIEKAMPKQMRTKALVQDRELLQWAQADAKTEQVQNALKYSSKLGDDVQKQKLEENRTIFETKALESVRKFVEQVPQAGDMLFKNPYYSRSLAGFLKARGYTAADIQGGKVSDAVLSEARGYAIQEAMKATFNDANSFSDFVSGLRYKGDNPVGKAANVIAEGVLPFRRTPANIAVRFKEYSPIELARGMWNLVADVNSGKVSAATAVDRISSGVTGTAAMALGYALANGMFGVKITGSGSDEDEKRQGRQDYALEFSIDGQEYSYTIDWAAPANLPFFVGANIYDGLKDIAENPDTSAFIKILQASGTIFEPMLELPCLSSLNDLVEGLRYAQKGEALYTLATDIATSYLKQGIPSLFRQAYKISQDKTQTTFANSADPTIRDFQRTVAGLPFVGAAYQTDKVNAWGQTEETGNWIERAAKALISPGTLKKIDTGKIETEISRLNEVQEENVSPAAFDKVLSWTDTDGNLHKDVRLTEEQYQTLAATQGQTQARIISAMIDSPDYSAMSDSHKAEAVKLAYSYAREQGEAAAIGDSRTSKAEGWMLDMEEGKEADAIIRKVAGDSIQNSMNALTNAWDNGYQDAGKSTELSAAYDNFENLSEAGKKAVIDEIAGTAAKYLESRSNGVSHEDFLSAAKAVETVRGTGTVNEETGVAGVRDIDKRQAIASTSGMSEKEVDTIMHAYMSDYDPDDSSPELTEVKYDYIRQVLGLSPAEYAETYRAHLDNSKKADKIAAMVELGYSREVATKLYKIYGGDKATKQAMIDWYE